MTIPNNIGSFIVRLPDEMVVGGLTVTQISFLFSLTVDRSYSAGGETMDTGIYRAAMSPDSGDTVEFAIVFNSLTGYQQQCVDRVARAYAYKYTTGLYNLQEGTGFPGLQWPLNSRVVENLTLVLDTFRPRGMGGAFRLYDPLLFGTVDVSLNPFFATP